MNLKPISFLLGLAVSQIAAQDLLASPTTKWEQQLFGASGNAQFSYGNGVFLTPDESEVVAVGTDGKVTAYAAGDGAFSWDFDPPAVADGASNTIRSLSGMTFTTDRSPSSYMVYAISYESVLDTDSDYTLVVALDMSGSKLYESPQLEGIHSGSPVVSDNGSYVFLTHNSDNLLTGHFTILTESLEIFVTRSNDGGAFAPIGIYHSPAEGFYDALPGVADGTLNTNDMLMWSLTPSQTGTTVPGGALFGFQFQPGFQANTDAIDYFPIGGARAFRTITPPLITNEGRTAYWSASRSEYFCSIGKVALDRARFNRGPTLREQFDRNDAWNGQPIWSVPAVASDDNGDTVIFGGTASPEFFRLAHNFGGVDNKDSVWNTTIANTTSFILASPVVDPLSRAVYFVESDGTLHQVDFTTIEDIWSDEVTIADGVQGEMAINGDGTILYVVSTEGRVRALSVAEGAPTAAPTMPPNTAAPTMPPNTAAPTTADEVTGEPTEGETSPDENSASSAKSVFVAFVAAVICLSL